MRKISLWAKHNILVARLLLASSHIALVLIACFFGLTLLDNGIFLTPTFLYISLAVWIIAVITYPSGVMKRVLKVKFYQRQKTNDFFIALGTVLIICYSTNTEFLSTSNSTNIYASSVTEFSHDPIDPTAAVILASLEFRDKSTLTKKEKRILKKEFKSQLGIYIKAKVTGDEDTAGKAGLIILTIVVALGLLYLVAALACSLSCNGMDGAAIAVALIGTVGVVWATIAVIRRINHGPRKKNREPMVIEKKD